MDEIKNRPIHSLDARERRDEEYAKLKEKLTKNAYQRDAASRNKETHDRTHSVKHIIGKSIEEFKKGTTHLKNFFMRNDAHNLKIGLAVAAASAAAYGAYKLYKAKFGDKNKAKQAQIQQLNKAKSMANKTENPNAFRKSIDDKINKIKQG